VLAALVGAIAWNLITWWLGLPSSLVARADRRPDRRALAQSGATGVEWHGIVAQGRRSRR
jgi:PiT family inorganic phosphate transporter